MNHRLLSAGEKLANRKRRDARKAAKKKARRQTAFLDGLDAAQLGWVHLMMLGPDLAADLQCGSPTKRRKAMEAWKISSALDGGLEDLWDHWLNTEPPVDDPPPVTHEYVLKGRKWRRKKLQPFTLW